MDGAGENYRQALCIAKYIEQRTAVKRAKLLGVKNRANRQPTLSASMSVAEFDHGYWYAIELKQFAAELGIASAARLRKDELERAITQFLRSGTIAKQSSRDQTSAGKAQPRDSDVGLQFNRRIVRYTNDAATKAFLEREAKRLAPAFKRRSGAMYRLNRWREEQLSRGVALTYRALVQEYVRLSQSTEPFSQIPHGRYINFVSDFMAQQPETAKATVLAAWRQLKTMDCPKTYRAWVKARTR